MDAFAVKSKRFPDGFLPEMYAQFGFEEIGRIPFDPSYYDANQLADLKAFCSSGKWTEADGYPDVVVITLEACHAREILEQAFARYGVPEIVNTDQGSQFTAEEFTHAVLSRGVRLSMDGKGAWRDNVFVERLWRTIKYERVYLLAYDGVTAAKTDIAQFIDWYNTERPHSSLDDQTPDQTNWALLPALQEVA